MTRTEAIALLRSNANQRGIDHWQKQNLTGGKWDSFGLGLTQLKKLAKQVGRDHDLALELWKEPNIDCKTLAILIDEPKLVTRAQVDEQVVDLDFWMLSHAYVSNLLSKVPFARELADEWRDERDDVKRRCSWMLIYALASKDKKLTDSYFAPLVEQIRSELAGEENFVRDAMNNALMAIGMRSAALHTQALAAAKEIGTVEVDYGDNSCNAVDVVKHLSGDRVKQKFKV
ncbi:hypothetical protein GF420_01530 [candidate division GN15 bacterium]|nr:hypothetical protein [candidate division GN15 bacterium]